MDAPTESQVTLVNPSPILELVVEKNSIVNTRLLVDGRPQYSISTADRDANNTDVKSLGTGEILAMVRRHFFRSDTVRFPRQFGGKEIKVNEWLVRTKNGSGSDTFVVNSESGRFIWRYDPVKRFVLFPENAPDTVLAYVRNERPSQNFFALCVTGEAQNHLDEIVTAFVLLEHRMQMETKAAVGDGTMLFAAQTQAC